MVWTGGLVLIRLCEAEPGHHLDSRCWTGGGVKFPAGLRIQREQWSGLKLPLTVTC